MAYRVINWDRPEPPGERIGLSDLDLDVGDLILVWHNGDCLAYEVTRHIAYEVRAITSLPVLTIDWSRWGAAKDITLTLWRDDPKNLAVGDHVWLYGDTDPARFRIVAIDEGKALVRVREVEPE